MAFNTKMPLRFPDWDIHLFWPTSFNIFEGKKSSKNYLLSISHGLASPNEPEPVGSGFFVLRQARLHCELKAMCSAEHFTDHFIRDPNSGHSFYAYSVKIWRLRKMPSDFLMCGLSRARTRWVRSTIKFWHCPLSLTSVLLSINLSRIINRCMETPWIEPGAAGCKVQMQPLCYAIFHGFSCLAAPSEPEPILVL